LHYVHSFERQRSVLHRAGYHDAYGDDDDDDDDDDDEGDNDVDFAVTAPVAA
jgi:hypothetical protein